MINKWYANDKVICIKYNDTNKFIIRLDTITATSMKFDYDNNALVLSIYADGEEHKLTHAVTDLSERYYDNHLSNHVEIKLNNGELYCLDRTTSIVYYVKNKDDEFVEAIHLYRINDTIENYMSVSSLNKV